MAPPSSMATTKSGRGIHTTRGLEDLVCVCADASLNGPRLVVLSVEFYRVVCGVHVTLV